MPGGLYENHWFEGGLYDLRRDPGERYDVLIHYPQIVKRLEEIALSAREDPGDDLAGVTGKNRREPGRIME